MPKASREGEWGEGVLLPSRLEGLGERRKLPSGVRGGAPAKNEFWCILRLKEPIKVTIFDTLCDTKIAII